MDMTFPESPAAAQTDVPPQQLPRVAKLRIQAAVLLGRQRMTLKEVCRLTPGAIIRFEMSADAQPELVADKTVLATGEAVRKGILFGFRVGRLVDEAGIPGPRLPDQG